MAGRATFATEESKKATIDDRILTISTRRCELFFIAMRETAREGNGHRDSCDQGDDGLDAVGYP
jgi:hypothetical protein